jgi:hypothetical protein
LGELLTAHHRVSIGGGKEWEATIGEALVCCLSPSFFFFLVLSFLRGAGVLIRGGSLQDGSGVSLEDHNDGTYTLSVMATLAGQHPLTVRH